MTTTAKTTPEKLQAKFRKSIQAEAKLLKQAEQDALTAFGDEMNRIRERRKKLQLRCGHPWGDAGVECPDCGMEMG